MAIVFRNFKSAENKKITDMTDPVIVIAQVQYQRFHLGVEPRIWLELILVWVKWNRNFELFSPEPKTMEQKGWQDHHGNADGRGGQNIFQIVVQEPEKHLCTSDKCTFDI